MKWWRLRAKIHSSWYLVIISASFTGGVALTLLVRVAWWLGVMGLVFVVCALWVRSLWCVPLAFMGSLVLGMGYGSAHATARGIYSSLIGKTVQITAKIKEDPSKTASGSTSLQLDSCTIDAESYPGTILITTRAPTGAKRGETVVVRGKVSEGFGNFPITISQAQIVSIRGSPTDDIGRFVRDWFAEKVRLVIPEPQASLGIGFLTGQKSALPDDLSDALKIAGLTHVVVASGYNLTVLVHLARRLFVKISKYLSMVLSSAMIIAFMAMTGLSPSMTRAGLVSGLSLASWYYGRTVHPFIVLPFAAALTVVFNPSYVWGDVGWQLSFAAFASVMIVAPLLQRYFFGETEPGAFRQVLGETVAAHLVTLPIITISFGTISNVAIVANLLVVPFVPLAMLLTFVCGVWSIAGIGASWLVAAPTTWLLGYMTNVTEFVSGVSWAQSTVQLQLWVWGVYGALLCAGCVWMWRVTHYNFSGARSEV